MSVDSGLVQEPSKSEMEARHLALELRLEHQKKQYDELFEYCERFYADAERQRRELEERGKAEVQRLVSCLSEAVKASDRVEERRQILDTQLKEIEGALFYSNIHLGDARREGRKILNAAPEMRIAGGNLLKKLSGQGLSNELCNELKQLLQSWESCLKGVDRMDQVFTQICEAQARPEIGKRTNLQETKGPTASS